MLSTLKCEYGFFLKIKLHSLSQLPIETGVNYLFWKCKIEADPLEDSNARKGTSDQHGQNEGPDIWDGVRCASEVQQRPLCLKGVCTNSIFCGGCTI